MPNYSHQAAFEHGFSTDALFDDYTYKNLGAFVMNVAANITSIEDFFEQYEETMKCNPYHKILDMINQGYKFCLGPAFPARNGKLPQYRVGLFCKNYREMAKQETCVEI